MTYHPKDGEALIEIDDQEAGVIALAEFLQALHAKWKPHPGQIKLGWALFYGLFKDIFACCGRNFGKTEFIAYALWRYAYERSESENYCFGPLAKQVREILWASSRIQTLGPEEYKEGVNNTEMRVTFHNRSFIKLDGSDNFDAYRGIKPKGLSVYDEFKDIRKEFVDAYDPNRAAFDSPAIYIGTPPEFHNHFVDTMEKAKKYHGKTWFYLHAPSSMNPHISARWLQQKRMELIEAGDEETWLREYEALYIKGGKRHIFPQYLKYKCRPLADLIPKDLHKWQLVTHFDPATTSTFGVLLSLFNPYTKKLLLVDEVYEDVMERMTTRQIWAQVMPIIEKWRQMGVRSFQYGYDEAAAWFMNETRDWAMERQEKKELVPPDLWLQPTKKNEFGIETGIGMVRDVFNHKMIEVADHLENFRHEMENYIKDEKGKIPKDKDHQINNLQYTLQLLGFDFAEKNQPKPTDPDEMHRGHSIEEDIGDSFGLEEFGQDLYQGFS